MKIIFVFFRLRANKLLDDNELYDLFKSIRKKKHSHKFIMQKFVVVVAILLYVL